MNDKNLADLIPAYALGALDPEERVEFEAWLNAHPDAQSTLADYQAVVAQLYVLAPPRPLPGHLQDDLRQRLAASRAEARRRRAWWQRPGVRYALAAAALLVLVIAAVLVLSQRGKSEQWEEDPAELYSRLAEEKNAQWYTVTPGQVESAVTGHLVASPNGDLAVIRVSQLPPIEEDRIFQLWMVGAEGTIRSGGTFKAKQGEAYIRIPLDKPIKAYSRFGVSIEPEGGSPFSDRPTGPNVFVVMVES